jgi:hypothetical protein
MGAKWSNDQQETLLAMLFLRYVAYCIRRRRYSQMQGAANLHGTLARVQPILKARAA